MDKEFIISLNFNILYDNGVEEDIKVDLIKKLCEDKELAKDHMNKIKTQIEDAMTYKDGHIVTLDKTRVINFGKVTRVNMRLSERNGVRW